VELETVRIIVLVDCYGVYISIFEFLNSLRKTHKLTEKTVDLAAIAAIAWSQFIKLATELSRREQLAKLAEIKASDKNGTILEQELWGQCKRIIEGNADEEDLRPVRKVIGVEFVYEWFFAPFPKAALIKRIDNFIENIENTDFRERNSERIQRLRTLRADAQISRVKVFDEERDYSVYEKFIKIVGDRLKKPNDSRKLYIGTYKFNIKNSGIQYKYISEKQVDILISVHAMDYLHFKKADALCIVSTDTDFIPLIERFKQAGISIFQTYIVPGKPEMFPPEHRELEKRRIFVPSSPVSWMELEYVLTGILQMAPPNRRRW
jgi:uncharacterized LabA/DUF88 family protein